MAAPDEAPVDRHRHADQYRYGECLHSGLNFDVEAYLIYLLDPQDIFALSKVSKNCYALTGQFGSALSYMIRRGRDTLVRQDSKAALWYMWKNWPRSAKGHEYTDPYTGWESTPYETVLAKEKQLIDRIVNELRLDELFLGTRKIEKKPHAAECLRFTEADTAERKLYELQSYNGEVSPSYSNGTTQKPNSCFFAGLGHTDRTYVWYGPAAKYNPTPDGEMAASYFGGAGLTDMDARIPNVALMMMLKDIDESKVSEGGVGSLQIAVGIHNVAQETVPLFLRFLPFIVQNTPGARVGVAFGDCPHMPQDTFTDATAYFLNIDSLLIMTSEGGNRVLQDWKQFGKANSHSDWHSIFDSYAITLPEKRK
jgi:hypothetical protein